MFAVAANLFAVASVHVLGAASRSLVEPVLTRISPVLTVKPATAEPVVTSMSPAAMTSIFGHIPNDAVAAYATHGLPTAGYLPVVSLATAFVPSSMTP